MRRILYLVLLLVGMPLLAQTTAVTANLTDADSVPWVNGTCTATLVYKQQTPAVLPYLNAGGNVPLNPSCTVNGSGALSASLTDVKFIAAIFQATWKFTVCPNVGPNSACGVTLIPVTGSSQDVSSSLNLPSPRVGGGVGAYAYADVEVASIFNNFYWNIVSSTCRQFLTSWAQCSTGSGGSGTVNNGAAFQMGCYPASGTAIGPCPGIFAITPSMTQAQINTLFASNPGTVFIPAGAPQIGYTSNGQVPHSFRLGDDWFQMPGVACDGKQTAVQITITQGSNTSNTGASFSNADAGKTFFFTNKSGYGYGFTQSVWAAKLISVSGTTTTWSANAPFSETAQVYYGTDNLTAINLAMTQAGLVFPLTIPTGCLLLANGTIPWNNNQVIAGRQMAQGGFIGRPGLDNIATTDTSGQSISSAGVGLAGIEFVVGSEIDATFPWNYYAADGTLTVIPPLYRPAQTHTPNANNPCGPGWNVGCHVGVASTTQNLALICVPSTLAHIPAVGEVITFPYTPKVFSTTVASTAGSCPGGSTARTMTAAMPNVSGYTVTQNEWFTSTNVQTTTTTIPGTPSYPFTLQLSNAIKPVPGFVSNFAQYGHAKIQDYEFDYMGADLIANTIVVRRGPASVNAGAGYSGTNPIVALNPCPAKFDQPWPVTPTLNSGDSTPSGANWFPGACIGNAAIAFPQANGNTFVGTGLVDGYLKDIFFQASSVQSTNSIAKIYVAGNNAPFGSTFDNLKGQGFQFGEVQGPASSGQHGVAAVGPTGFGNTYHNIHFFDAFPLSFVDMQDSTVDGLNLNSTMISPYDGTAIGAATCLQEGYTLDEQTGGQVTTTQFNGHHVYGCEPENGSHIVVPPAVIIDSSHPSFDTANFEGTFNVFAGDHLKLTNSYLALPAIDYGVDNDFGTVDGSNAGYITNVWDGTPQMLSWGKNSKCAAFGGTQGPAVSCGAGFVQGYEGHDVSASLFGSHSFTNLLGGVITPWMWNPFGNLDTNPMTTTGAPDPTASYWGSSATCNLGGGAVCQTAHFNGFHGYLYIGPWNQISDGLYSLDASFKTLSAGSTFTLTINVEDSGTGQCTAGFHQLLNTTVTTTTAFTPFNADVDFTGKAGCVLDVVYQNGSTTDTLVIDRFNLIPRPGSILGPGVAPTEGGSCSRGSSWLGAFGGFTYFCDGGTVKRVAIT